MAGGAGGVRERLAELWRRIDNTHFSYLETDDSPDKLDQRKKLEGYILDYLFLVPHESKFFLQETGEILSRSMSSDANFSGYRLARGWSAIARYAANLLSQPWRKEYSTIRLYSGFYKHEIEGSGLRGAIAMLCAMGYKAQLDDNRSINMFVLDGPVCPDQVAAVSRDSLIAYVECQLMTQIWEEISLRGGNCTWLDILHCRETYIGDVEQSVSMILHSQRTSEDIYCNINYPANLLRDKSVQQCDNASHKSESIVHANNHSSQDSISSGNENPYFNGFHTNSFESKNHSSHDNIFPVDDHFHQNMHFTTSCNRVSDSLHDGIHQNGYGLSHMHGINVSPQFSNFGSLNGYYCNPSPGNTFVVQTIPPYNSIGPVMSISNGYHCQSPNQMSAFCLNPSTGQIIDLRRTNYKQNYPKHNNFCSNDKVKDDSFQKTRDTELISPHNVDILKTNINVMNKNSEKKMESSTSNRRNSAPKSNCVNASDHNIVSIPRSDTQPSLRKAKEDGMGTFESWDYVFRNLEIQGYSKDSNNISNVPSLPHDRDSKTLDRVCAKDVRKHQQQTMDLEDALRSINLKDSEEEQFRTAKVNETLARIKQESEAKAIKTHSKRQILVDEREKQKSNSHVISDNYIIESQITDKTRLISKEDAKSKKEMDKEIQNNINNSNWTTENKKNRKNILKCLSNETEKTNKKSTDHTDSSIPSHSINNSTSQQTCAYNNSDVTEHGLKTRLVVALRDSEISQKINDDILDQTKQKKNINNKWECGTCTFLNANDKKACEMCGKSKQTGVEILPLTSGGRECPACTLVNQKEAVVCAACDTSLKHSPTYI